MTPKINNQNAMVWLEVVFTIASCIVAGLLLGVLLEAVSKYTLMP